MKRRATLAAGGRTAFIDLIFILLAFVVVVSGIRRSPPKDMQSRELEVELPHLGSSRNAPAPEPGKHLTLRVKKDGRVFVNRSRVPISGDRELRAVVARHAGAGTLVEIDADAQVPLQTALRLVETLRATGLKRIQFLATAPATAEGD